ncbi:MAG: 23S rRNA (uracil(1939)-C(5))-methyltransferase RlmD [Lachnospiraceae bacterium]|nr:23S rRNA (uracil(1939)-C(5))-methyltransferase RlmD [Lachnospiraceae bacterium]
MTKEKTPYQKNEIVEVAITDIGDHGEGIGKTKEGYTLFIKDAVPGDTVRAATMKARARYGYAHLEEILSPSPDRVLPPCKIARQCGGCQLQALSYEKQLRYKEQKVKEALIRIGGLSAEEADRVMEPIVPTTPLRYRNKMQVPFGRVKGEEAAGFYAGRTHSIIPMDDCLLGGEETAPILQTILSYMKEYDVSSYDEASGEGLIRHVLLRREEGQDDGGVQEDRRTQDDRKVQVHLCLVAAEDRLPKEDELVRRLRKTGEENGFALTGIVLNVNDRRTNVILGEKERILWGDGTLTAALRSDRYGFQRQYRISPKSFYQVNPHIAEQMYEKVLELAALSGEETVLDLYCGIGTISLFLAAGAKEVIGVEIVPEAVRDAEKNAALNGVKNARFLQGTAEDVIPELYRAEGLRADVVVVDPPRKGCDEKLLHTIAEMAPEKLVYVSCDPATLARDIHFLSGYGFRLQTVTPFDQFAMTTHIEVVSLLQRVSNTRESDRKKV